MRNSWKVAILAGALLAGTAGAASADSRVRFNVSVGFPAPVYVAPAPIYASYPAPVVVYTPPAPVYYYPPAAYYTPPVRVIYTGHRHHRHHRHWR